MPRGGKRARAGRPKGKQTLEKEALRALVRERVAARMRQMVDAQISNAVGINYLVVRQRSTGKFLRRVGATGETHDADTETIEIWEKDPSTPAFTDLMNRVIDKPAEQVQELHLTGQLDVVSILKQRHARRRTI